jgi:hypothetical protein
MRYKMNKWMFPAAILVLLLAGACKSKSGMPGNSNAATISKACYRLISERDTVDLSLKITGDSVTGMLHYNMFEKDDSEGFIKGHLTDSIIMAEYTFVAEGQESNINEVVFMLKPDAVIQGFGELVEKDGKYVFSDSAEINFVSTLLLVPCAE